LQPARELHPGGSADFEEESEKAHREGRPIENNQKGAPRHSSLSEMREALQHAKSEGPWRSVCESGPQKGTARARGSPEARRREKYQTETGRNVKKGAVKKKGKTIKERSCLPSVQQGVKIRGKKGPEEET